MLQVDRHFKDANVLIILWRMKVFERIAQASSFNLKLGILPFSFASLNITETYVDILVVSFVTFIEFFFASSALYALSAVTLTATSSLTQPSISLAVFIMFLWLELLLSNQ